MPPRGALMCCVSLQLLSTPDSQVSPLLPGCPRALSASEPFPAALTLEHSSCFSWSPCLDRHTPVTLFFTGASGRFLVAFQMAKQRHCAIHWSDLWGHWLLPPAHPAEWSSQKSALSPPVGLMVGTDRGQGRVHASRGTWWQLELLTKLAWLPAVQERAPHSHPFSWGEAMLAALAYKMWVEERRMSSRRTV